jgi:hypothetical protein
MTTACSLSSRLWGEALAVAGALWAGVTGVPCKSIQSHQHRRTREPLQIAQYKRTDVSAQEFGKPFPQAPNLPITSTSGILLHEQVCYLSAVQTAFSM